MLDPTHRLVELTEELLCHLSDPTHLPPQVIGPTHLLVEELVLCLQIL